MGVGRGIAAGAAVIAVLTVAARLAGFGRILVFNSTVGATSLGDAYQAANTIPNIIFELVAGGALAGLVVPILVGAAAGEEGTRGRRVAETASALLTWVVTLLVPVAIVVAVAARPLVRLLFPAASAAEIDAGTDLLRLFAPQLPLYGVGIVLAGVLQTHRRFAWPVLAPLLSSLTVIVAYIAFGVVAGRAAALGSVSDGELLILSLGTTLGVAVLSLCLFPPVRRLGLRLRPTYRLGAGQVSAVRRLAVAGIIMVGAQQLALGLSIALAAGGPVGSVVLYALTQTLFLLPWAVLAVPLATAAYPALAEAGAARDAGGFAATLAPAVRSLLLLCGLGAAALVVLAEPAARILVAMIADPPPVGPLAAGIAAFAPGLLGYGLFALLSRALYARGDAGRAAAATALGWAAAAAAALALCAALPGRDRVAALAAANSIGMTVLGGALLWTVARRAGRAAVAGSARTLVVCVLAATAAIGAGLGLRTVIWGGEPPGLAGAAGQGILCGVAVLAVYAAVAALGDPDRVRPLVAGLRGRLRRRNGERVDKGGSR